MKFSDLNPRMRSMIAALNSTNHMNTAELGHACLPQIDAQSAANMLNELRGNGLVFSMQKPESQKYANWAITTVGRAVFMGRPDGDVVLQAAGTTVVASATAKKRFIIGTEGGTLDVISGSRDYALAEAQRRATAKPGGVYRVYEQIAEAHMPVPQAQITLL
jgi:hypothetical protein